MPKWKLTAILYPNEKVIEFSTDIFKERSQWSKEIESLIAEKKYDTAIIDNGRIIFSQNIYDLDTYNRSQIVDGKRTPGSDFPYRAH